MRYATDDIRQSNPNDPTWITFDTAEVLVGHHGFEWSDIDGPADDIPFPG